MPDTVKLIEERYPHLTKATLEISYDNGGIFAGRTEQDVRDKLTVFVDVNAKDWDFAEIDAWLGTLSEEDLVTVCIGGDESNAVEIMKTAPLSTDALLNDLFEEVS